MEISKWGYQIADVAERCKQSMSDNGKELS